MGEKKREGRGSARVPDSHDLWGNVGTFACLHREISDAGGALKSPDKGPDRSQSPLAPAQTNAQAGTSLKRLGASLSSATDALISFARPHFDFVHALSTQRLPFETE